MAAIFPTLPDISTLSNKGMCLKLSRAIWQIVKQYLPAHKSKWDNINNKYTASKDVIKLMRTCRWLKCVFMHEVETVVLKNPTMSSCIPLIKRLGNQLRYMELFYSIRTQVNSSLEVCDLICSILETANNLEGLRIICQTGFSKHWSGSHTHNILQKRQASKLKFFEWIGCTSEQSFTHRTQQPFCFKFQNLISMFTSSLKVFSIADAYHLQDHDVQTLCTNCKSLQILRLYRVGRQLTAKAFEFPNATSAPNLQCLFLTSSFNSLNHTLCTQSLLANLATAFPKLQCLDCGMRTPITMDMCQSEYRQPRYQFLHLKTLRLLNCFRLTDFNAFFDFFDCTELKDITIYTNTIKDEHIALFAQKCKHLTTLRLSQAEITDSALHSLAESNLKNFQIFECGYNMHLSKLACDMLRSKYSMSVRHARI